MFTNFSQTQNLSWKFFHPIKNQHIEFGEKGTVQEKLIEIGELPDPFYGKNEEKFAWIEKYDWEFISEFTLSKEDFQKEFVIIDFPVVDTYSKIYLNDKLIAETNNAFHPYKLNIKKHILEGKNVVKVIFQSPVNFHKKAFDKLKTKYPAPNDVGEIAVASMSRKPQYQFGWDWALRMTTIGFWEKVSINSYNSNKVSLIKIETDSINQGKAFFNLSLHFEQEKNEIYKLESELFGTFEDLSLHSNCLKLKLQLDKPKLWFPRGLGEAFLYEDKVKIYDEKNNLIYSGKIKFGVRTSELIQEKDQWGTSFYFKINGEKIFLKGANYIPQDIFPSRITDESTKYLIEQMVKSNFNAIRVWGGGFYQKDFFYETCDSLGIMVWQDLMFACAMYPGDKDFLESVEKELNYQIPRISKHPSVIYFNGNNEVDVAWKNWGFQIKYLIGPKMQKKMEQDYVNLFKILAPNTIKKHTILPYEHTSPLSNWGKDEYFNHGTMHYWGVWHGKDPIEDFGLKTGRFNAEYGFQSFPEFSTLSSFSEKTDWNLNSDVMKHHQKSYVGNGMMKKHSDILYHKTDDFSEFVYLSQLTQAKAVGIAISGHRSDFPRCMGTLYWQMNDCWPAPTWSSIDYFNNWKALQYQVKKDYEDIAIITQSKKIGEERYFFISDLDSSYFTSVKYQIYDLNGTKIFEKEENLIVDGPWLQEIAHETQEIGLKNKNYVIQFTWKNKTNQVLTRTFFNEKELREKAKDNTVKLEIESIDLINNTAKLKLFNSSFIADTWIFSHKKGIEFSENFENYLPGIHFIDIKFKVVPLPSDFNLMWR
jgi:beta-mannosidase